MAQEMVGVLGGGEAGERPAAQTHIQRSFYPPEPDPPLGLLFISMLVPSCLLTPRDTG